MSTNPVAPGEPIGTEVHISCAANPITTFALGLCNCETGSHHVLTIQLSRSHVAKIFLTFQQIDRLAWVLDGYSRDMHDAEHAEPIPEAPGDRPSAQGNPEATE